MGIAAALGGCDRDTQPTATAPALHSNGSLPDALEEGRNKQCPVVVLVIEPGRSDADETARSAFSSGIGHNGGVVSMVLELNTSRNRAEAAFLHGLDAPTLVCMSARGTIVSRDEGAVSDTMVRERSRQAIQDARRLDQERAQLESDVQSNPADAQRKMALANFFLNQHNDREAIPLLRQVANDVAVDLTLRVRAWVAMARAHLWVIEPEKARHAAEELIATLGQHSPDAIAGGNLVRGLQDHRAKRYGRARSELTTAVTVAPDSEYGREAAELLRKIPADR